MPLQVAPVLTTSDHAPAVHRTQQVDVKLATPRQGTRSSVDEAVAARREAGNVTKVSTASPTRMRESQRCGLRERMVTPIAPLTHCSSLAAQVFVGGLASNTTDGALRADKGCMPCQNGLQL